MGRVKNTMQLIEKARERVDSRYIMCSNNAEDIAGASQDIPEVMDNSFLFGYMQGLKAAGLETLPSVNSNNSIAEKKREIVRLVNGMDNEENVGYLLEVASGICENNKFLALGCRLMTEKKEKSKEMYHLLLGFVYGGKHNG